MARTSVSHTEGREFEPRLRHSFVDDSTKQTSLCSIFNMIRSFCS